MKQLLIGLSLLGFTGKAMAHAGHGSSAILTAIAHPFTGLDHLLVMVAVGFWAAKGRNNAALRLPSYFLALFAVGVILGQQGFYVPMVETSIAVTLIALGASLLKIAVNHPIKYALIGIAAVAHGLAHGILFVQQSLAVSWLPIVALLLSASMILFCSYRVAKYINARKGYQGLLATLMIGLGGILLIN